MVKQPNSRANLDKAIQRLTDGDRDAYIAIRAVIANAIVGQISGADAIANAVAMFTDDFMEGTDDLPLQEREINGEE